MARRVDQEIRAVKIINSALKANPQSYPLLHAQTDFLLSKSRPDWAQLVAQQAVNSAPSEFVTWAKLTETYIELGHFDSALLTLNSCPMFTFNERDLHRMPTPARTHLPVKKFISDSQILDEESARDNEADVALLRLPAPGLRGTFAKAYTLLTLLVSKIGWDELLRTRSMVFVMEEEYRLHKTTASVDMDGGADGQGDADDGASTRGVRSPVPPATPSDIPTIRISSESTRIPQHHARGGSVVGQSSSLNGNGQVIEEEKDGDVEGDEEQGDEKSEGGVEVPDLEKPETAQSADDSGAAMGMQGEGEEVVSAFSNKRLCERWLDNLFLCVPHLLRGKDPERQLKG